METLDVLLNAREEIVRGWCKDALEDEFGNVCAIGALGRAWGGSAHVFPSMQAAQALRAVIPGHSIAGWNNASSTTKEDVIAAFDRAINAEAQRLAPTVDPAHVHLQSA